MSDIERIRQACLDFSACIVREQTGYQYEVRLKNGIQRFVSAVKTDLTALVKVIPTLAWAERDAVTSFLDELTPWATPSFIESLWKLARREKDQSVQFNLISALIGYLREKKSHEGQLHPPLGGISQEVEASYRQQLHKLSRLKNF